MGPCEGCAGSARPHPDRCAVVLLGSHAILRRPHEGEGEAVGLVEAQRGRMRGHPDVRTGVRRRSPHRPRPCDPSSVSPPIQSEGCHPSSDRDALRLHSQGEKGEGCRPGRLQDVPGRERRLHQGGHQPPGRARPAARRPEAPAVTSGLWLLGWGLCDARLNRQSQGGRLPK